MATNVVTATIRPVYGERQAPVRPLFRTGILVLRDTALYRKGQKGLRGESLKKPVSLIAGCILVPNWSGREKPTHACYRSIYDAIRGAEHTLQTYQASNGELASLPLSIESGMRIIRMFLRYGRLSDDQRRELQNVTSRLAVEYDRVRNPHKVRARIQLGAATQETDRLGRKNPRARLARVAGAVANFEFRLADARALTQAVGPRKTALLLELDRLWTDGWIVAWRALGIAEDALRDPVGDVDVLCLLDQAAQAMNTIDVQPYLAAREEICGEILLARSNVLRLRPEAARELVARSREAIRFKRAGYSLHEILLAYSLLVTGAGEDVDLATLTEVKYDLEGFVVRFASLSEASLKRQVKQRVLDAIEAGLLQLTSRSPDRYELAKAEFVRALSYL